MAEADDVLFAEDGRMARANAARDADFFGASRRWRRRDAKGDAPSNAGACEMDAAVAWRIDTHRIFDGRCGTGCRVVGAPRSFAIAWVLFKRLARTIGGTVAVEAIEAIECALKQCAIHRKWCRRWCGDWVRRVDARRGRRHPAWCGTRCFADEHVNAGVARVGVFDHARKQEQSGDGECDDARRRQQ